MSIRDAAAALGVTEASVMSQINQGRLATQLDETGSRLVLVKPTDSVSAKQEVAEVIDVGSMSVEPDDRMDAPHPQQGMLTILTEDSRRAMQMAIVASQQLAQLSQFHAERYRRSARFAWSLVGLLTLILTTAVALVTFKITRTDDQIAQLTSAIQLASARSQQPHEQPPVQPKTVELPAAQPAALLQTPATQPTTRPSLLNRLASLLDEPAF